MMLWTAVLGLSLVSTEAHALWPDDVTLSQMASWQDEGVEPEIVSAAYDELILELGAVVANKPFNPTETLGANGLSFSTTSSFSFISSRGDNAEPSSWQRAHISGEPPQVQIVPRLNVRKGLPLSMEVGGTVGYLATSRQTIFSGFGRWGLIEGYRQFPDLSLQVGYSGYVGNNELELGAMDWGGQIGYSLPFGTLKGINETIFSPYVGVGQLLIHAHPRFSETEQEELGVRPVSGFSSSEVYDPNFKLVQVYGGFRILKGSFQFLLGAAAPPKAMPTVTLGMGFVY